MFSRRVLIPVVLVLTLLLQFLPGTVFSPRSVAAATPCNWAQFIADVTIPDGTTFSPGATFVKTWRLKNIGTCTWTTSYAAVFVSGSQMGAPVAVNLPTSVAPGATVDITVNMTAPSASGHYRGNWELRNASGGLFGVGASASYLYWVDINVNVLYSVAYDFVANYCSATWTSGAGTLPCPGTDGNSNGFVYKVDSPQLENGSTDSNPGLVINPQYTTGGYIQAVYPAYTVQAGDRFQSIVNCAYNAPNCYVGYRLNYQIGSGPVATFWSFNERYEGLYYPANIDLSSLAGQSVKFILYVADVSGRGVPSGDKALWGGARIVHATSGYVPPPATTTCNIGAFVADVTIPDGTSMAPGTSFTKTWRIKNVGTCTWTTDYALVFVFGNGFAADLDTNLTSSVAPGTTADFSVNMVAPSTAGHYRSYWRFRNAAGAQFGVGSGMVTFFADIYVAATGTTSTTTVINTDTPDPSAPGQSVNVRATVSGSGAIPTGTVAITGADTNCTITLTDGDGGCNVVFNTAGAKTLTATYSGNASYSSSVGIASHTVSTGTAASTTTITADTPDPSTPGETVAVTVTVSGAGATPTGTVAITGADANCTITLSSGSGSCNATFDTVGAKTLTATYSGDVNYATSTDTESHTVSQGTSTTTITADASDPSVPFQTVSVSVAVSGAGVTPTGTVAITGADTNCTITLSGGSGSCSTVVFNTEGAKTLTATYSGDTNYAVSSDTESHAVKNSTVTTITADTLDPSAIDAAVAVTVTVTGSGTTPTGTVDITGADTNCTIALVAGSGSCNTVVFDTAGAKTLTATYSGDSLNLGSSDTETHTVSQGTTTTTIVSDAPDPSVAGETIVVSVTVAGSGAVTPIGTVDITGADINCTVTLVAGSGSCNATFTTAVGSPRTLTATYSGDGNYTTSSDTESHTVNPTTSTTVITADAPDPSVVGGTVTVSVTVSGAGTTPTGTVAITGADTNCTITLVAGSGSCSTVVFDTAGAKTLTATYSGDGDYTTSSDTESHTVDQAASTTVITADAPDPSVVGETVAVSVTVSGAGVTPTGTVDITGADTNCTITLVAGSGSCNATFTTTAGSPRTLTATYSGDGNYTTSSGTASHAVNPTTSTTTITSDLPDPSVSGETVIVNFTVSGAGVTPTGTVTLTFAATGGGTPPGSSGPISLVGGVGSYSAVFTTAADTFTITATYSGDGNYTSSIDTEAHIVN
ncbi:MAG: Ig-like domain repeat protein [Chloroflexota bacterium]